MQTETSEKPGHSGATAATVLCVVLLLLVGPLVIVLAERACVGTFHFDDALQAAGVHDFYKWLYDVTGITDMLKSLLGP